MSKKDKRLLKERKRMLENEIRARKLQKELLLQKKELKQQIIERRKHKVQYLNEKLQQRKISQKSTFLVRLKKFWNESHFLSKVLVIASGTAFAQGLQVLFSPLLTRLYSPVEFGLLTIFISIIAICSKIVDLKYSIAIPLTKKDEKAVHVFLLSITFIFFITLVMTTILWIVREPFFNLLQAKDLKSYVWLIGLGILGVGIYQTLNQFAIRHRAYLMITLTKMNQSFVQLAIQLLLGFFKVGNIGLLLGDVVGRMSGSSLFASLIWRKHKDSLLKITLKNMWEAAKEYRRFPIYSTWASLLNGASLQITPIMIAINYGTGVAGLWAIGDRVVGGPLGLIGTSVSQVFLGEGAKIAREQPHKFQALFYRTARNLFLLGLIPSLFILLFGPSLFQTIFGEEWMDAGKYVQALSLMYLSQFTVSPLSSTLDVLQKQDWELLWDFIRLVLVVFALLLAPLLHLPAIYAVLFYSIIMILAYICLFVMCIVAIKKYIQKEEGR